MVLTGRSMDLDERGTAGVKVEILIKNPPARILQVILEEVL